MQKPKNILAKVFSAAPAFLLALSWAPAALGQGWNPGNYTGTGLPRAQLGSIIANIALWLLAIFGFIAVIGFVISGIMYLLSAGDEDRQEQAKRAMYYSITGVIVGLVGLVVIYAVNFFLGGASGPSGAPTYNPSAPNTPYLPPSGLPSGWNRGGQD